MAAGFHQSPGVDIMSVTKMAIINAEWKGFSLPCSLLRPTEKLTCEPGGSLLRHLEPPGLYAWLLHMIGHLKKKKKQKPSTNYGVDLVHVTSFSCFYTSKNIFPILISPLKQN